MSGKEAELSFSFIIVNILVDVTPDKDQDELSRENSLPVSYGGLGWLMNSMGLRYQQWLHKSWDGRVIFVNQPKPKVKVCSNRQTENYRIQTRK